MTTYKVCVATGKTTGRVIASLTHIVETDEKPKNYSLSNERFDFDYKFFDTKEKAEKYVKELKTLES